MEKYNTYLAILRQYSIVFEGVLSNELEFLFLNWGRWIHILLYNICGFSFRGLNNLGIFPLGTVELGG